MKANASTETSSSKRKIWRVSRRYWTTCRRKTLKKLTNLWCNRSRISSVISRKAQEASRSTWPWKAGRPCTLCWRMFWTCTTRWTLRWTWCFLKTLCCISAGDIWSHGKTFEKISRYVPYSRYRFRRTLESSDKNNTDLANFSAKNFQNQSYPGVAKGKCSASGCWGQWEAKFSSPSCLHLLIGSVPDFFTQRIQRCWSQGNKLARSWEIYRFSREVDSEKKVTNIK